MLLVMIDDGLMYQVVGQGLCVRIEEGSGLCEVYFNVCMIGDKLIGIGFIVIGLVYNKEVFVRNGWKVFDFWQDLINFKYKQKVVILFIINGYGLLMLVMMVCFNGGSEEKIVLGFDVMIKKVVFNVLVWEFFLGKMVEMLQMGEVVLVVWGNGCVQVVIDQGVLVEFVYFKEGVVVLMLVVCVVEGVLQFKLVQQFLQYVLLVEVQVIFVMVQGWGLVNKNIRFVLEVMKCVVYGFEKVGQMIVFNYGVINVQCVEWINCWNCVVEC